MQILPSPKLTPQKVEPRPITPHYFATRSPLVSRRLSEAVAAALAGRGLLDSRGMLPADPGYTKNVTFLDFMGAWRGGGNSKAE